MHLIDAMTSIYGVLTPTKTHRERVWMWLPQRRELSDGRLTIYARASLREGAKREACDYMVQDASEAGSGLARVFLLSPVRDEGEGELYETTIDPALRGGGCTCRAGSTGTRCKHVDALLAILAAGGLPR